jgi:hypothetical protein
MGLLQDLRFALQLLVKDRWFTLVAVVTLALGIAANNAVFTFVNAVLIRGIPFKEADRIVALGTRDTRNRNLGVSFLDFEDWRRSARSFSDMCLYGQPTLNVSDAGRAPERYNGAVISANIFRLLDVRPLLGPGFTDEDDNFGAPPHVVLGYGVWQTYINSPVVNQTGLQGYWDFDVRSRRFRPFNERARTPSPFRRSSKRIWVSSSIRARSRRRSTSSTV